MCFRVGTDLPLVLLGIDPSLADCVKPSSVSVTE